MCEWGMEPPRSSPWALMPLIILTGKHFTSLIAWQQGWDSQERNKPMNPNARLENCFLITPHLKTHWDLKEEKKRQKGLNNLDWLNWDHLTVRAQCCSTKPQLLPEETAQRKLFSLKHIFNAVP